MSRHVTYRGATLDMDFIRRENEKVPAIGNMSVNAKGDQIKGRVVTKTVNQVAKESHLLQSAVVNTGLKGPAPAAVASIDSSKPKRQPTNTHSQSLTKEVELPSGDIMIEGNNSES